VLLALSPNSVQSDNVRKELDLTEEFKKTILPVEIQATAIPNDISYQIVGLQRINLYRDFEGGARQVLDALGSQQSFGQADSSNANAAEAQFRGGEGLYESYSLMPGNDPRTETQLEAAIECFRKAAEQGNAAAQNAIGYIFAGTKNDAAVAIKWFERAAKQGDVRGWHNLGRIYEMGPDVFKGVVKSKERAATYYRKSAEAGFAQSQVRLGNLLESMEKKYAEAAIWYRRASEKGHPDAIESLAALYKAGRGVQKDEKAARDLEQKANAIRLEHPEAIENLAIRYQGGFSFLHGVEKDERVATELSAKAKRKREELGGYLEIDNRWLLFESISPPTAGDGGLMGLVHSLRQFAERNPVKKM
jgi:TPR repeat protein